MRIFHVALRADWDAALSAGSYEVSRVGRTLAEEGFIHASREEQWEGVLERYYSDVSDPLVLLVVDTDLLDVEVREDPAPGGTETFPHVYGALPPAAVVDVRPLPRGATAEPASTIPT